VAEVVRNPVRGDVIVTAVADEEDRSLGTEAVLEAGWRADAAVVCEPTGVDVVVGHKGFVWIDVTIMGVAAHGSRPESGVDAISRAGYFLVELDALARRLRENGLGGSVHASIIRGGEEESSYPAKCVVSVERRTVPDETADGFLGEVMGCLRAAKEKCPGFEGNARVTFSRDPWQEDDASSIVTVLSEKLQEITGKVTTTRTETFWADCALISAAGMPVVMFGPAGHGLHSKEEWVDVKSMETVMSALNSTIQTFCN
jgi:acetylornithine deacetylase/succinyl-diaminopimelate desuccinylase-like protein